jgi:hypothetical protein
MILGALILALAAQSAVAWADGPSGSKEDKKNQVKCGEGNDTPTGRVFVGPTGIESCSDDNTAPDGRIILSGDGQYASADGDADNPEEARGWARLDSSGLTCSTPKESDSTKGPGGDCGSAALNRLSGNFTQLAFQVLHLIP